MGGRGVGRDAGGTFITRVHVRVSILLHGVTRGGGGSR